MDGLDKLLRAKKLPKKPDTLLRIEEWCAKEYPNFKVTAQQKTRSIILTIPAGPLTQEIHMRMPEIRASCGVDVSTRITIRVS